MNSGSVERVARVLRGLVSAAFAVNLLAIPLVPGAVLAYAATGGSLWICILSGWVQVWTTEYTAVLALFLMFCGVCTAVILWQGRRVLNTVLREEPFSRENAASLRRAAVSAFLIAGAALVRVVWGLWFYGSVRPLLTYNALFVPIFAMAGLLCLVMSALFRRAAELKAENDLTI